MKSSVLTTYWCKDVDLLAMKPEDFNIEEIAHALSLQCRYNGHTARFYSVAEHSVRVSEAIDRELQDASPTGRAQLAFEGLMHDAAEAYTGDIVSPLKLQIGAEFSPIEGAIERALSIRYGMPLEMSAIVHRYDTILYSTEVRDLFINERVAHTAKEFPPLKDKILPWTHRVAEVKFLKRFDSLGRRR